jgi:hypothetical protein
VAVRPVPWLATLAATGGRWPVEPTRPAGEPVPVPAAPTGNRCRFRCRSANRHPVTAGKFRVPILDFVFNPEILPRKPFGLRENGQTNFGNPF